MLDRMNDTARAFWTVAPGRGELRPETLAAPGPGDVVVETLYSGISRGTESTVFHGRVPPEEYQRMRAPFQVGDFPGPLKYGYANVGRIVQGAASLLDRTVFSLYPHQTRHVVPATAVHVVPDAVPAARAVLAADYQASGAKSCPAFLRPDRFSASDGSGKRSGTIAPARQTRHQRSGG